MDINLIEGLLLFQGLYYFVLGIWPVLHIKSFLFVTGPKVDLWLVKTVGLLIAVLALPMLLAAWREHYTLEVAVLALSSALILALVDIVYAARRVISKIYLADGVAELMLVALWTIILVH